MNVADCKPRLQSAIFSAQNQKHRRDLNMNTLDYYLFTIDVLLIIGFTVLLYPDVRTFKWYRKNSGSIRNLN